MSLWRVVWEDPAAGQGHDVVDAPTAQHAVWYLAADYVRKDVTDLTFVRVEAVPSAEDADLADRRVTENMVTRASEILWSEATEPHTGSIHGLTEADIAAGKLAERDAQATEANRDLVRRALEEALVNPAGAQAVTEYGNTYKSGDWLVWNTEPLVERYAPLAERIEAYRQGGGSVSRRSVIVVDDWTEVTEP